MDIVNIATNIFSSTSSLISFFFKSFAVVLSAIFLIYALVLLNQTNVMTRVIRLKDSKVYFIISMIQVILAFVLFILAIALV